MKINSRIITAIFPKKYKKYIKASSLAYHLRNFLLAVLILFALFQLQLLVILTNGYGNALAIHENKAKKYEYWKSVISQFPNVPDILYNTSLSAFNAGYKLEALDYVEKALRIDPLFEDAVKLKNEMLKG